MRVLVLLLALAAPASALRCPERWGYVSVKRCLDGGGGQRSVLLCLSLAESDCVGDALYYIARIQDAAGRGPAEPRRYLDEARFVAENLRGIEEAERRWGGKLDGLSADRLNELESLINRHGAPAGSQSRDDDVTAVSPAPRATEAPFRPRKRGPEDDSAPGLPLKAAFAFGTVFLLAALGMAWWTHEGPDGEGLPEYGRPPVPGQLIAGRWKLDRRIEKPGVPEYEAREAESGKPVMLRGPLPVAVTEFHIAFNQAEAAARVTHPALIDLYHAGKDIRGIFVATERLEGQPLDEVIARGPMDPEFARRVAARLADALARLHEEKRVHGGFGPRWVLLRPDGTVKVRGIGPCPDPTPAGLREPGGREPDFRSDQYAWAAVCFAMLCGAEPFGGADGEELKAHSGGCPSPSRHRAGLPPALDGFFRKALDPYPALRFQDMKEAVKAFEECWVKKGDSPLT